MRTARTPVASPQTMAPNQTLVKQTPKTTSGAANRHCRKLSPGSDQPSTRSLGMIQ